MTDGKSEIVGSLFGYKADFVQKWLLYSYTEKDYPYNEFRKHDTSPDGDAVYRQTGYVYGRQRGIHD